MMAIAVLAVLGNVGYFLYASSQNRNAYSNEVDINQTQLGDLHKALVGTIDLSFLCEGMYNWSDDDLQQFKATRLTVDSILSEMKTQAGIDNMRNALKRKEHLLTRISELSKMKGETEEHLAVDKPITVKDTETTISTRDGNIFHKRKEEKTSRTTNRTVHVQAVDENALALQRQHKEDIRLLTDSLNDVNQWITKNIKLIVQNSDGMVVEQLKGHLNQTLEKGTENYIKGTWSLVVTSTMLLAIFVWLGFTIFRLKKQIRKNNNMIVNRRRMMYSIVHDLRTPLGIIIGYNDMERRAEEKKDKYINEISTAAAELKNMIDHLLDYFRLESDKMELDCKNFNLMDLQHELVNMFKMRAEEKRLEFVTSPLQDKELYGDCEKIKHIVTNLLDNAFKFTKEGTIHFGSYCMDNKLFIDVQDTGIGIKPKDRDKIYEAFIKMPNAEVNGLDGLGIGLSIVKLLVDLMNGTIEFNSSEKGTSFAICLPLQEAIKDEDQKAKEQIRITDKGKCVLVVDDNDHWLEMIKTMLEDNGIGCDTCNDSKQVFTMIRQKEYSLVITDLKMPGMSGLELLRMMRKTRVRNSQSVPVVVSTSSGEETREELIAEGFDECLFKDFSTDELVKLVNKWIQKNTGTITPDYTRLRKTTADSLIEDTEESLAHIHKFMEERNLEKVGWWSHHLKGSWVLYRVGVLFDPIIELAIHKDDSDWQQIEEYVKEIDKTAEMLINKAKEIKGER